MGVITGISRCLAVYVLELGKKNNILLVANTNVIWQVCLLCMRGGTGRNDAMALLW